MTRDNLLFAIIGILFGFIVGFMFASQLSQRQAAPPAAVGNQALPSDHPAVGGGGAPANPGGMQAEVSAALDKARKEPTNFEAQLKAAELYYQIQRYDDAINYLLKANQLKPDSYETIANLGMVNMDGGHFDVALKWYRAALLKKPDDVTALDGMVFCLLQQGDAKGAEEAIGKLEKIDPTNQDLAQFREKLANLKSAKK